jgi:glycosyltransferase involved in cell wall biosynthesis
MSATPRVAMLSVAPIGAAMSSPAIRAYELGRALRSAGAQVSLFADEINGADALELPSVRYDRRRGLGDALDAFDVVVGQPQWPAAMRDLRRSGKRLIFDLFYPDLLEKLERESGLGLKRRLRLAITRDRFNEAMRIGHKFICGSERQLDLWLGAMMARGLIDPAIYERDPSLRSVIDVVPFGLPEGPPEAGSAPWSRFAGIEEGDEVVLWSGGIWPWFDAETAVRAIAQLAGRRPRVRLVFMAGAGDDVGRDAGQRARSLARDLGALDRHVFFNDEWVPYRERGAWLSAADCGLICHGSGLEARFSLHSRALDCYWAGLPLVSTDGDVFSDEIERDDLGATAPPGDAAAVAAAIETVLERGRASYGPSLQRVAERYRWANAARPLVRFAFATEDAPRLGQGGRRSPASAARSLGFRLFETVSRVRKAG